MTAITQAVQKTVVWGGFRVWQRNRDAFQRSWSVEIGGMAVEPFLFLLAIGYGLGKYVQSFDGVSYAEFVAPGILGMYAMMHATFDTSYGSYLRMELHHVYDAILFTPLEPEDIVVGEVMWGATRSVLTGVAVLVAMSVFGLAGSPMAVAVIPVAFLIGVAIGSLSMTFTAVAPSIGSLTNFFTLFISPMSFFCGVFFPLDRLPAAAQVGAWALPLTPGVALIRGFSAGDLSWMMLAWVLELVVFSVVGLTMASILMRRRLVK